MKITLKNVRLAFPVLFTAEAFGDSTKEEFSGSFLIDPKDPQVKELNRIMDEVANEKWKDKGPATIKALRAADKTAIHNGDAKEYDGFAGNLYISARNEVRPVVLDRNKAPLTAADGKPYAGCYVDVSLDIWAQENKYGKRINAKLHGVRFVKDGDAFTAAGATGSADDFDDLADGADAEETDLA